MDAGLSIAQVITTLVSPPSQNKHSIVTHRHLLTVPYPFLTLNPLRKFKKLDCFWALLTRISAIRIAIYAGATSLAYISLAVINSLRPASPLITTQNHGKVE